MKKYILTLMVVFLLPILSYGANDVEGRLKKVYSDFITISYKSENPKSEDMDRSRMGELSIVFDAQTHFENFSKLSDLKEGDKLGVVYRIGNFKKEVADTITKLDPDHLLNEDNKELTTTTVTTVTTTNSAISSTP